MLWGLSVSYIDKHANIVEEYLLLWLYYSEAEIEKLSFTHLI